MNINFTSTLITILSLLYIGLIAFLVKESYFETSAVKDIAVITSSFSTLVIALLLYDRFDYRKKIFEKKLQIVLDLLENIKSTKIQFAYRNIEKEKMFVGPLFIDKKQIDFNFYEENMNTNAYIIFQADELHTYFDKISLLRAHPFMPKEIVNSLEFLSINRLEGVKTDPNYQNEYIKLSINKSMKSGLDLEDWYKPGENIQFITFIKSYLNCLSAIEQWINKHSNIRTELNL